jgi:NADH:ubiquinone oxidoreductase subunit 3 (subunit A)
MIKALLEAAATIGLMLALFAAMGVLVIVLDALQKFHRSGIERVRRYEARERAAK